MIYDPSALTATLLMNFVTVQFPRADILRRIVDQGVSPQGRTRCQEHAAKADALAIGFRRQALRSALLSLGYREFMDFLEPDPNGGWRLHLFLVNPDAVPAVPQITDGSVGPGDPVKVDPHKWVERRVAHMRRVYEGAGWWDWHGIALA